MDISFPDYPLAEVLEVKHKRVEDAERNVKIKEEALRKEIEILKEKEAARDKVLKHRNDKLQQMRDAFDEGTTTDKIEQMKFYLDVVKENLAAEEKKVEEQQDQVEIAEKNLEVAKQELRDRRKEVDKLETHKVEWKKEVRKELELEIAKQQDEIGSTIFLGRWVEAKARSRQQKQE